MSVLKNPIQEAERHLENSREILSTKAGRYANFYTDPKYVKMAGNTAWNGVLVALDAALRLQKPKSKRLDFQDYQQAVSIRNKKMNYVLLAAYDILHKAMGYDGNLAFAVVQEGLKEATILINWAKKIYTSEEV